MAFPNPLGPPPTAAAQESIHRDLRDSAEEHEEEDTTRSSEGEDEEPRSPTAHRTSHPASLGYSIAGSYHRPSFIATGPRPSVTPALQLPDDGRYITKQEHDAVRKEQLSLLRDNHIVPTKEEAHASAIGAKLRKQISAPVRGRSSNKHQDGEGPRSHSARAEGRASETSPLLGSHNPPSDEEAGSPDDVSQKWDEAVESGMIKTSWQREAKVLAGYSWSLILTFFLQFSLTMASIFTVGRLGKVELGAVSLGAMTANITGYALYQGLATSLDTLCAQAYGSGRKKLVGLQMQRMLYFLWCITIPIGIVWLSGSVILEVIVPDKEVARLAGLYLKILLFGAPGYAAFESGKRFLQAQGLFTANLYILLILAPLNAFMSWLFVWRFQWGFVGAPIAIVVTDNLLPVGLILYVRFVDGRDCWGGVESRALQNWGPMVRLALPGLLMILAEYLAFEILTLAASWLSTEHLAAQTVISTVVVTMFIIPLSVSIAASTRIANLIGATLVHPAKTTVKVALVAGCFIGLFNAIMLGVLRRHIARLFTDDEEVVSFVAQVLQLLAIFPLFDALQAFTNGILRGMGRQKIGGWVCLVCYYAVSPHHPRSC